MRKTRAAILGGGWFGQFHLDNLLLMDDVEVVAFATANVPRLQALSAKAPGAHPYPDHRALLAGEPDLDALVVCVPPDRHDGIELECAQRRINLFMEKPLGVSLAEVRRCDQAIRDSGIVCAVGYHNRYNPHVETLRRMIRDGGEAIGTVVAKWMGVMPETPWWRVKARSGGQLAEQVTHIVDVMRYWFGDVESVFSTGRAGLFPTEPPHDVEDASATVLAFGSGTLATVTCGCFIDPAAGESEIRIEAYGRKDRLVFEWDRMAGWSNQREERTWRFGNEFHFPALRTFIEAVRSGDGSKIRSSYSDAFETFKTTWAANLSMRTHAEVAVASLPDEI